MCFFVKRSILICIVYFVVFERFVTVASFLLQKKIERCWVVGLFGLGLFILGIPTKLWYYQYGRCSEQNHSNSFAKRAILRQQIQKKNRLVNSWVGGKAAQHLFAFTVRNTVLLQNAEHKKLLQVTFYCFIIISFKPCPPKKTCRNHPPQRQNSREFFKPKKLKVGTQITGTEPEA